MQTPSLRDGLVARWLCLLMLTGCGAQPIGAASREPVPALQSNMARVWILRQADAPGANVDWADPVVYANSVPLAPSAPGTVFFHDFQPGFYSFAVQPDGVPFNLVDTLRLTPGTQTYVQLQAVPNVQQSAYYYWWKPHFAVRTMSPEVAQPYLQTMTYIAQP